MRALTLRASSSLILFRRSVRVDSCCISRARNAARRRAVGWQTFPRLSPHSHGNHWREQDQTHTRSRWRCSCVSPGTSAAGERGSKPCLNALAPFRRPALTFWIFAFSSSARRICRLTSSRFSRRSSMPAVGANERAKRATRRQFEAQPTGLDSRSRSQKPANRSTHT